MRSDWLCLVAGVFALGLVGCGGGGAIRGATTGTTGGSTGGTGTLGQPVSDSTARFHVDVTSGKVTITPLNTSAQRAPAIFRGNMVGFASSLLVDEPGDTGRKVLNVSLTNNTGEAIGSAVNSANGSYTGLNVLFGPITQTTALTSVENLINVSTRAGLATAGYVNGALGVAKFDAPTSVAFNPVDSSIWVADFGNAAIRRIGSSGVTTIAGGNGSGETDGSGSAAKFSGPYGIAYDPLDQSFIVTDYSGNKIRRVTQSGVVTTVAGTGAAGLAMGAGSAATFTSPTGVAVSPAGTIYVSGNDNIVRTITQTGSNPRLSSNFTVALLAGSSSGTAGSSDGVGSAATFNLPRGLALDPSGNIYVADFSNNEIRLVSPTSEVVTIAGTGTAGDVNGTGSVAEFHGPLGLAYANGFLAVTDSGGDYVRFLWLSPNAAPNSALNWNVANAAGTGTAGATNGVGSSAEFKLPYFACADKSGNFYLADYSNNMIREVAAISGTFAIGTLGGSTGTSAVVLGNPSGTIPNSAYGALQPYIEYLNQGTLASGASTATQQWEFVIPSGVTAFDFEVSVEADTTTAAQPDAALGAGSPNVDVRTFAGAVDAGAGYINGGLNDSRFSNSMGQLSMDGMGNIYVADEDNNAVRIILNQSTNGAQVASDTVGTVAGTVANASGGYAAGGDTGLAAKFRDPQGVAVTPDGKNIYVADSENFVLDVITTSGAPGTDPSQYTVYTIAGTAGTSGNSVGLGSSSLFADPISLAMSPTGDLYMSDYVNDCVYRIQFLGGSRTSASDYYVTTFASGFDSPAGLACDISGNVYVCDSLNYEIKKITPNGAVSVLAGSGTAGYQDGVGTSAEFEYPYGIAVDSAGYVYVTDYGSSYIRRIAPNGYTETVAGTGVRGDVDGPGNIAQLSAPTGICMSPAGTIFFCDGQYNADSKARPGFKRPIATGSGTSNSIRMIQQVISNNSQAGRAK